MVDWTRIIGFDWDAGNARKSSDKHEVSQAEAEQAFFLFVVDVAIPLSPCGLVAQSTPT